MNTDNKSPEPFDCEFVIGKPLEFQPYDEDQPTPESGSVSSEQVAVPAVVEPFSGVRVGDYSGLRTKWVSAHLGYKLPSRTLGEWSYFEATSEGRTHRANQDALTKEFDERVWPSLLAILPDSSILGPFPHPGDPPIPERVREAHQRALNRSAQSAFSTRRKR